jgi:MFS family permease
MGQRGAPGAGEDGYVSDARRTPETQVALGGAEGGGLFSPSRHLVPMLGGRQRARVIVVLAAVLALSSADTATVGSAAIELRRSLHIGNTDVGLLVAVTSVVAAVFSLPFGVLADRVRRTWLLGGAVLTWGVAMVWSATAGSFHQLLVSRLALGAVSAVAGPTVASLVGDWFRSSERGQIYSFVLTGELLGAGAGFALTGEIAALSWRAAFLILAFPTAFLAWAVVRLKEPERGGRGVLAPEPGTRPWQAAARQPSAPAPDPAQARMTDAQRLALERGILPNPVLVDRARPDMGFVGAVRWVLAVRTNVALIISGACGYYFLAGVETFGVEFVSGHYRISPVVANLLLVVVGSGAVIGVVVAGPLGDTLLRRGRLSSRPMVAAVAASIAVVFLVPALMTHSALAALPYIVIATMGLSGQNPPIDAARLDIVPSWLWGRAEGVRTFVRTAAQALAPLLFGAVSVNIFGGGANGLYWTFVIMLAPLTASAVYLFHAARHYPKDVATAAAAQPPPGEPWSDAPQATD